MGPRHKRLASCTHGPAGSAIGKCDNRETQCPGSQFWLLKHQSGIDDGKRWAQSGGKKVKEQKRPQHKTNGKAKARWTAEKSKKGS